MNRISKINYFFLGISLVKLLAKLRPPMPESKMPIGNSDISKEAL